MSDVPNNDEPTTLDPDPPPAGAGFVRFRDIAPATPSEADADPESTSRIRSHPTRPRRGPRDSADGPAD